MDPADNTEVAVVTSSARHVLERKQAEAAMACPTNKLSYSKTNELQAGSKTALEYIKAHRMAASSAVLLVGSRCWPAGPWPKGAWPEAMHTMAVEPFISLARTTKPQASL
eukprot:6544919-Lingulodinium_polyedra.AAC.1